MGNRKLHDFSSGGSLVPALPRAPRGLGFGIDRGCRGSTMTGTLLQLSAGAMNVIESPSTITNRITYDIRIVLS